MLFSVLGKDLASLQQSGKLGDVPVMGIIKEVRFVIVLNILAMFTVCVWAFIHLFLYEV
jgi:hypothetical protein